LIGGRRRDEHTPPTLARDAEGQRAPVEDQAQEDNGAKPEQRFCGRAEPDAQIGEMKNESAVLIDGGAESSECYGQEVKDDDPLPAQGTHRASVSKSTRLLLSPAQSA
jgi:hypothetical protein